MAKAVSTPAETAASGNQRADAVPTRQIVGLGDRAYPILIGAHLLRDAPRLIADQLGDARLAIVTDENVAAHQLTKLGDAFSKAGLDDDRICTPIIVAPGEASKRFATLETVCDGLLAAGIERGDAVIALGGGVIGDLTGFAASILRRGVRFVQIPTSLLAQVDSSVGGKTGINTPRGKNLIGTFHQPSLVLIDTETLATLPPRQLRAGYAEVVKYGLLGNATFFAWLEQNHRAVLDRDPLALRRAIETSCAAKAQVVADDEREQGRRALLNLGHTFGHALEAWAGYSDRLLHGEAISIGMAMAFRYSTRLGLLPEADADRVTAHFETVGLPTRVQQIPSNTAGGVTPSVAELVALMAQDKKVNRGRLTLILARAIGDAFVTQDIDPDDLAAFLAAETETAG